MTLDVFDICGRRALVTGSTRGIGRALARGLVEAGCTVVMHGRDPRRVERVATELTATAPGRDAAVHHVAFDVTDAGAVAAGVAAAEAAAGPLDILVNNAGMQHRAPLLEVADEA
ncbi:MAG TPA: SDR family NAD(P)-dependent oxidoreductase, partial [Solirubrobacteraceae bacterium]